MKIGQTERNADMRAGNCGAAKTRRTCSPSPQNMRSPSPQGVEALAYCVRRAAGYHAPSNVVVPIFKPMWDAAPMREGHMNGGDRLVAPVTYFKPPPLGWLAAPLLYFAAMLEGLR